MQQGQVNRCMASSHDRFVVANCHPLGERLNAVLPAPASLPWIAMTLDSNCESIAVTDFAVFKLIASIDRSTCS